MQQTLTKTKQSSEGKNEKAWKALFAARGILKNKGKFKTSKDWADWRHNAGSQEMLKHFEKKFNASQK